jgi:uncharacterized membrane protein
MSSARILYAGIAIPGIVGGLSKNKTVKIGAICIQATIAVLAVAGYLW